MKDNKNFILGLLAGIVVIPIIEELLNVVFTWIEYLKILPSKLVLKGNDELSKLRPDGVEEQTSVIGFQYNEEEYDDDFEEE